MSEVVPLANGTTNFTSRDGHACCASVGVDSNMRAAARVAAKERYDDIKVSLEHPVRSGACSLFWNVVLPLVLQRRQRRERFSGIGGAADEIARRDLLAAEIGF